MASSPSVLRVNATEERDNYLQACSDVIARIIREHETTLIDIAEKCDISLSTISNAFNRKSGLSGPFQARLGKVYGAHCLDPIAALSSARMIPLKSDPALDAMPPMTAAIHRLAVARSPDSPGGEIITHTEMLAMETEIDAAIRALTALKLRCNELRAA